MQCMKCGREISGGQVFCQECLEEMEKYPVDPDVVVTLPSASGTAKAQQSAKHPRQRTKKTAEEKARRLERWLRITCWSLVVSVSLLVGAGGLIYSLLTEEEKPLPGQNYSGEGENNDPYNWYSDPADDLADKAEGLEETESTEGRQNLNGQ